MINFEYNGVEYINYDTNSAEFRKIPPAAQDIAKQREQENDQ
ncbi:hypothetical protein [Pseudoalteromonas sp. MMG013]|nr:hypothetical protein [Pseudoalteromonas sp. MMG013]